MKMRKLTRPPLVNPQAINQPGLDILTANVRSVLHMREAHSGAAVALVAVGALLVGSIRWTVGGEGKENEQVRRGDELGYFAYGGSTVIALFPRGAVAYDQDLLDNSRVPMETLVKVGFLFARCASSLRDVLPLRAMCCLLAWVHTRPHSTLGPVVYTTRFSRSGSEMTTAYLLTGARRLAGRLGGYRMNGRRSRSNWGEDAARCLTCPPLEHIYGNDITTGTTHK